jgi:hypothetical protein
MDISKIRVEVTDEVWNTRKGNKAQRLYYHGLGGKYPEKATRYVEDGDQVLQPGVYAIGGFVLDWGKLVVDFNSLSRIEGQK